MMEDPSECHCAVWTPVHRHDDRSVVGLTARENNFIPHYPYLCGSREADALVEALRIQLLDRQSDRSLNGEPVWSVRMKTARKVQRTLE